MNIKSVVITLTIGNLLLASCTKENLASVVEDTPIVLPEPDPLPTQQATMFYFGGTWCGPCGSLGKPAKEALKKQLGDTKVSIVSCQMSDPMNVPDADSLAKLFEADRVPYLYAGGADEPSERVLVLSTMSEDAVAKANTYLTKIPTVNIRASFFLNTNGLLQVDARMKFFKDVAPNYYVAAYLTEDSIVATQTSDASIEKNIHYSILRTKMGTNITGDLISESDIKTDMIFTKSYQVILDANYKKSKLKAVVVVWMKNADGKYFISNSIVAHIIQ